MTGIKGMKGGGGKRANAGRKPKENKKQPISIYVRPSDIETIGGKDAVREVCNDAIDKEVKKKRKPKKDT